MGSDDWFRSSEENLVDGSGTGVYSRGMMMSRQRGAGRAAAEHSRLRTTYVIRDRSAVALWAVALLR